MVEAFCFRSIERAECYAGKRHGLQSNGVRLSCQHHYPITPGLRDHRLLWRAGSPRRGPISQLFKSVRKKVQTSAQTEKQKTHSRMLRHCRVTLEILICPSALPSQRTQILRVDRSIRPERMCTFRKTTVALVCSFIPSPFFSIFSFFFVFTEDSTKRAWKGRHGEGTRTTIEEERDAQTMRHKVPTVLGPLLKMGCCLPQLIQFTCLFHKLSTHQNPHVPHTSGTVSTFL